MHHSRIPLALAAALAAAVALPTATVAAPASDTASATPTPKPAASDGPGHAAFADALDRVRARQGLAAVAAVEPPRAAVLWVSDGTTAERVTLDATGASTGHTTYSDRTDVVVGPAGDSMAYTSGGATVVRPLPPTSPSTVTYDTSDAPVAWGPAGDGFALTSGTELLGQSTNPDFSMSLGTPSGSRAPAISPYGGEAFVLTETGTGTDIAVGPAPFIGSAGSSTTLLLGLQAFTPEAPAVGEEPGSGVDVGVNDGATYLAFEGLSGGTPWLLVDHQDGSGAGGYGSPVPVMDVGKLCGAAAPTFSPNRRQLAYVRAAGAPGSECSSFEVRVVDSGANGRYEPTDSDALAYTTTTKPTVLSFQASNPAATYQRIDGANRYEVSANTAHFYDAATTQAAVVAGAWAEADALSGGPLATMNAGPLVLTDSRSLRPETAEALQYSLAPGKTVYILGGTVTVPAKIETAIQNLGYQTKRIPGANRYEVAVNVAKEMDTLRGTPATTAFVSSGWAFADALVAGPPAALNDGPILLSNGSKMPTATQDYLDAMASDAQIFAIGGSGKASVSSDPRTEVVDGATRYDVAANVAQRFFAGWWILPVADGRNWPDAASAGALMGLYGQPILLNGGKTTLPTGTAQQINQTRESIDSVLVFGGPPSVPEGAATAAHTLAGAQTTYYGYDLRP